jgi:hypothetical protein
MTFNHCIGWTVLGAALVVACGGESTSPFSPPVPDASSDGGESSGGAGGKSGAGGSKSSTGGLGAGGTSGASGGSAGSGNVGPGGAGAGGTGAGGAGGCAPPADKTQTAVCVTLVPEKITAEADPTLDEKGVLAIQIFDTPNPPEKNASQVALAERIVPANPGSAEIALDAIQTERLVATLPSVVYVRALFIDNAALLTPGTPFGWGAWIGGLNVTDGFQDREPLLAVKLGVGEGNPVSLSLVALRKLTVTVHTTATPLGDGQGKLTALVFNQDNPKDAPAFGLAQRACADVSAGDVTLTGFVIGAGPYYVTGALNDFGLKGDGPPGTLAALVKNGDGFRIPQKLTIAKGDYTPSAQIDLSYVVPLPHDAGTIPPNSCADLGGADGGAPDGGP